MKRILVLFTLVSLYQIVTFGQKKYEMVVSKTDGTEFVANTEDIVRTYFREREETTDYTATYSVKEMTMESWDHFHPSPNSIFYQGNEGVVKIYEAFNNKYALWLYSGRIHLIHYWRLNGSWTSTTYQGTTGLISIGKCNNINDIISKDIPKDAGESRPLQHNTINQNGFDYYFVTFSAIVNPNDGYAAYFTTDDGEKLYLRIYIKSYTLDNTGALNAITIQYQLY